MPRFVAKEDVQKGLVDPKKPINQQPEYKKKLQEEAKKKQFKHQERKFEKKHEKKQQKKEVKEGQENKQPKQEKEKKQRKPKRERQDRPVYNWNKRQITLETPLPEAPKKILAKPDFEKFDAAMKKLKEQKETLFQQRLKFIEEQKFLIKSNGDNKKNGFNALSQYAGQLKEKNNLKNIIDGKIKKLQEQKQSIEKKIASLKQSNTQLRTAKDIEHMSTEQLKHRIDQLQHRLSTAKLDKKQQNIINNDINACKRALLKSRPQIEVKTELSKTDDSINMLYADLKNLKKEIDSNYKELNPLKKDIRELLQKRKAESGTITQVRSVQQIRAQYDAKIKGVDAKRQQAGKKMDQLRAKFNKQRDAWQDQQDLLRYIQYVKQQKAYKQKRKDQQQRRQKQKQQQQKKKQKQFEQRKKRRQQRQKQQLQRKQKQQQRKLKLQKQRQDFINRNPNHQKIDVCQFMIRYCQNLKPENNQKAVQAKNVTKLEDIDLKGQKGWEKQAKSGCQVVVSKKDKKDQEKPQKPKKEKKVKQAEQDGSLNHNIDTINRFHDLNILPPQNLTQIDQTIKQLRDKIDILNKPSQQQVAAFKAKATVEFDRIHGFIQENEHHEEEKPSRHEKKRQKVQKVQLQGQDFPELN